MTCFYYMTTRFLTLLTPRTKLYLGVAKPQLNHIFYGRNFIEPLKFHLVFQDANLLVRVLRVDCFASAGTFETKYHAKPSQREKLCKG